MVANHWWYIIQPALIFGIIWLYLAGTISCNFHVYWGKKIGFQHIETLETPPFCGVSLMNDSSYSFRIAGTFLIRGCDAFKHVREISYWEHFSTLLPGTSDMSTVCLWFRAQNTLQLQKLHITCIWHIGQVESRRSGEISVFVSKMNQWMPKYWSFYFMHHQAIK